MRAYSRIAKVFTDKGKLLLNGSGRERKHQLVSRNAVAQAIVFYILIDNKGNSENALFPCFLFRNGKPVYSLIR